MGLYASDVARNALVVAGGTPVAVAASSARNGAMLVAVGSWLGEHTELLQVLLCLTAW